MIAAALSLITSAAHAARAHLPYPRLVWPIEITGSQYAPVAWADIAGWNEDDHLQAFNAFRTSCKPISAQQNQPAGADPKGLGTSLRDPCRAARAASISDGAVARAFFEQNFLPMRISRLGEDQGFVTGYYEPVIDGSRTRPDVYTVPVYRRPSNLFVRGYNQESVSLPNKGEVFRKIGRRKLIPYYDRGEIEDGAIAGRGLEICWLKDQTDLLFTQIQGSARVHLEDGSTIRINYDAHNGYPYTAVGRILIDPGGTVDQRHLRHVGAIRHQTNVMSGVILRRACRAVAIGGDIALQLSGIRRLEANHAVQHIGLAIGEKR